jgi:hypothetical protein
MKRQSIHTDLTDNEYMALRKALLDKRQSLSKFFSEYARNYLKTVTVVAVPGVDEFARRKLRELGLTEVAIEQFFAELDAHDLVDGQHRSVIIPGPSR